MFNRYLMNKKEGYKMDYDYMELYDKFRKLQWLLQKQRMMEVTSQNPFADTSRGQGRVLALLKIQPQISTKDLTYLLGIRQQSLNELLNKMEKGGYVERKPSEKDRRVMIIHLTEKGKNTEQPERKLPNIFGSLNPEEQKKFGEYLDRIIKSLEDELGVNSTDMEEFYDRARSFAEEDRFGVRSRGGFDAGNMGFERRGRGNFATRNADFERGERGRFTSENSDLRKSEKRGFTE
jgi:DNA-binding MarR family transcriptional regulator